MRDRMIFRRARARRQNRVMTVFPDTQAMPALEAPRGDAPRDSFRSQTPIALLAIVAVGAILAVNTSGPDEALAGGAERAPSQRLKPAPALCAECGEVISIRRIPAGELGDPGPDEGYALELRMNDGSRRIVKQFAPGFDVGDRVRVNGNALTLGG
jgi:hypothetical protein